MKKGDTQHTVKGFENLGLQASSLHSEAKKRMQTIPDRTLAGKMPADPERKRTLKRLTA